MASRLVLCIGDLFIPDRAPDIPPKFQKLLAPGKIGQTLCLGNLTSSGPYNFLRGIAPDFHAVRGDFDVEPFPAQQAQQSTSHSQSLQDGNTAQRPAAGAMAPLTKIVTHGDLRIGMIHGHTIVPPGDADVLLMQARQMDVDVLLWAGTHRFEAYELEGRFFINPGSGTGAWSSGWWAEGEEPLPSFVLMDVQGENLIVYFYQLKTDDKGEENVSVEKMSFKKSTQ
ncbi:MAG: hypothetical protein Q9162_006992 [Coniocarpon cinnabarinum]